MLPASVLLVFSPPLLLLLCRIDAAPVSNLTELEIELLPPLNATTVVQSSPSPPPPKRNVSDPAWSAVHEQWVSDQSQLGRVIILACAPPGTDEKCRKRRTQIPNWVKAYNEHGRRSGTELVRYKFVTLTKADRVFGRQMASGQRLLVLHVMSDMATPFEGDLHDKLSFIGWLRAFDELQIWRPTDAMEFDGFFDRLELQCGAGNYSSNDSTATAPESRRKLGEGGHLLLVYHPAKCNLDTWRSVARLARLALNANLVEIRHPLNVTEHVTLRRRIPVVRERCPLLAWLADGGYVPIDYTMPKAVVSFISSLSSTPPNCSERSTLLSSTDEWHDFSSQSWHQIPPRLTDIQLDYASEAWKIYEHEQSAFLIAVGVTGGVAALALAISIFWGLNGTAFRK